MIVVASVQWHVDSGYESGKEPGLLLWTNVANRSISGDMYRNLVIERVYKQPTGSLKW
jgi:hypothetical protein